MRAHVTRRTFTPLRPFAIFLCALTVAAVFGGCAMERAVGAASDAARGITTMLINKAPITQVAANAEGEINNPHYRVLAVAVQGVLVDIGLDGVQVEGQIQGQGQGENQALSEAAAQQIRDALLKDDSFLALLKQVQAMQTATTGETPVPQGSGS